jgi:hypothetical protein
LSRDLVPFSFFQQRSVHSAPQARHDPVDIILGDDVVRAVGLHQLLQRAGQTLLDVAVQVEFGRPFFVTPYDTFRVRFVLSRKISNFETGFSLDRFEG